jgi:hypothetical protein
MNTLQTPDVNRMVYHQSYESKRDRRCLSRRYDKLNTSASITDTRYRDYSILEKTRYYITKKKENIYQLKI